MSTFIVDPATTRDLTPETVDSDGRPRILPAAFWAGTTLPERVMLGHKHGIYAFPTIELVAYLQHLIGDRSAIEIGAGNGVLAEALGIPATDSRMQEKEPYRQFYANTRQPIVRYGPNIIECDGYEALRRYRPDVVICCWVTHRYNPRRHAAGGSEVGLDEHDILDNCATYVIIGNEKVHEGKEIWEQPHTIDYPDWVVSRASTGARDFIATFPGRKTITPV